MIKRLLLGTLAGLALAASALPALAGGTFAVINDMPNSPDNNIAHVYVYRNSPGTDQFSSGGYIVPGDHVEFTTNISGCNDFKLLLETADGERYAFSRVNVCDTVYDFSDGELSLTDYSVADIHVSNHELDRHVEVYNDYDSSIIGVYASNTGTDLWGPNLLSGRIRTGNSRVMKLDDHSTLCAYDIRIVTADKQKWVKSGFNVCSEAEIAVPF